jgi:hypothetical protein
MPSDVIAADRWENHPASKAEAEPEPTRSEAFDDPFEANLLSERYEVFPVDVIEFIELGGDVTVESTRRGKPLRAASDQVFFGLSDKPLGADKYIQAPDGLRDLVDRAQAQFSELFPVPPPKQRPQHVRVLIPWIAAWDQLRWQFKRARVMARRRWSGARRWLTAIMAPSWAWASKMLRPLARRDHEGS